MFVIGVDLKKATQSMHVNHNLASSKFNLVYYNACGVSYRCFVSFSLVIIQLINSYRINIIVKAEQQTQNVEQL